jgi:caffeoyl-CoA O-methyltransferase
MSNKIEKYLLQQTPQRPPVMKEMEQYAVEHDFPIVGPVVGRFLHQMALSMKARSVLELGSGYGYSAFWFSLAMRSKGSIVMTDFNKENKKRALAYFRRAGLESRFDYRVGDALRIARRLTDKFDLVFCDIDKESYPEVIDLAALRLNKGGMFITDNLLWSGRVCDRKPDRTTRRIVEFTEQLYQDSRFFTTVLPLRDGIALAVRR